MNKTTKQLISEIRFPEFVNGRELEEQNFQDSIWNRKTRTGNGNDSIISVRLIFHRNLKARNSP